MTMKVLSAIHFDPRIQYNFIFRRVLVFIADFSSLYLCNFLIITITFVKHNL